ncbi:LacI family DNA-binding transcriptional regulator [Paenibacillus sp. LHD-117]|uniref:LacI family DNA-binding transcriptional regulator n=1 Tax=Paenibacillus sp. LHD-117 TaxID=3071412 RepID=UPI0027DF5F56|nr:LacI family DNA-binding transcriptional regulator [Paenibacillus sp. LHD-117]MDQ6419504.1 LacI family DNA-binding transcriptional regulator [Paenibacillus sp. LHD-117]
MKNEASIVDVARAAGVSIATVSNVINGKGRVSATTKQKIERIIGELGYTPNLTARNLKTNRSDLIGLVVPTMQPGRLQDNPFYWDLLAGVEEGARDRRFHIILAGIDERTETFSFVKERRLDGLIVVGTNEGSQAVGRILELGLPTVFIDSYLSDPNLMQVYLEDRNGSYLATNYLIKQGHGRIALLIGDIPLENISYYGVLHERWLGYKDALAEAGIPYDPRTMIKLPTSLEGGYRAADQLIDMDDVTAIFSFSDVSAMGLLKRLRERGKEVPRDYSVIGFDNLFMSEYTSPSLTTIAQDILTKGREAVHLLLDQIDGSPITNRRIAMPVDLIVRQTTGPCRTKS